MLLKFCSKDMQKEKILHYHFCKYADSLCIQSIVCETSICVLGLISTLSFVHAVKEKSFCLLLMSGRKLHFCVHNLAINSPNTFFLLSFLMSRSNVQR